VVIDKNFEACPDVLFMNTGIQYVSIIIIIIIIIIILLTRSKNM